MMTPGGGARFMITRVGNKQPQCSVEIFPRLHFQPRRRSSMVLVLAVRTCHGIISHVRDGFACVTEGSGVWPWSTLLAM
jgi:hypothetical protein